MKKLLAVVLSVAMLLTCGVVLASASYATSEDSFREVGDVTIDWDPDASSKIVLDGNIEEWTAAGYNVTVISGDNMVSWVGNSDSETDPGMPADFAINTYFVSDTEYLYIAFWIVDDKFAASNQPEGYGGGDAFQLAVDFNQELKRAIPEDPDNFPNPKNIFYSFACHGENDPILIMRQESDNDGNLTEEDGVKGVATPNEGGWCAEFAISWNRLFEDFAWKAWEENYKAPWDADHALSLGLTICYLSADEAGGGFTWAAGTFAGNNPDWTPMSNGMSVTLPFQMGYKMECEGIVSPEIGESVAEIITDAPTEAPATEAKTDAPATEAPATEAPATQAPVVTEAPATDAKTEAPADDKGCASVIGGAVAVVLSAMVAGVALKKKH